MLSILRAALGLLFALFLPGFTLTRALFPRKKTFHPDYDMIYQIAIGIALTIIIVILLGISMQSLGVNPETGKGYFVVTNIAIALVSLTAIFFVLGWWRGAYPWLGWFHPKLNRIASSSAVSKLVNEQDKRLELNRLVNERGSLINEIEFCEERSTKIKSYADRAHYGEKLRLLYQRLEIVNAQIDKLEGGAFQRYAQMKVRASLDEEGPIL